MRFLLIICLLCARIVFAQQSEYVLQTGHMSSVKHIEFNHDHTLFFSKAEFSNEVFCWTVQNGKKTNVFLAKDEESLGDFAVDTAKRLIYLLYGSGKIVFYN